ncbi:MAG: hypothetical protein KGL56_05395 [Alphaproteobacteria bacterium]|nr:hypothetical protein [Alphaproteobacteria bacterium]MDE2499608.1 hypothetical protein [Alphaproteobacteria bacterium]
MFWNLFTTTAFIIAGILFYRFWPVVFARLKRFDAENHARIEGEIRDRGDSLAHFRHTLRVAEEQIEAIGEIEESDPRTGVPVKRYVLEGEWFASRREAERAREEKVRTLARKFYMELPAALSARKGDDRLGRD